MQGNAARFLLALPKTRKTPSKKAGQIPAYHSCRPPGQCKQHRIKQHPSIEIEIKGQNCQHNNRTVVLNAILRPLFTILQPLVYRYQALSQQCRATPRGFPFPDILRDCKSPATGPIPQTTGFRRRTEAGIALAAGFNRFHLYAEFFTTLSHVFEQLHGLGRVHHGMEARMLFKT